jgi:hypothetical protein
MIRATLDRFEDTADIEKLKEIFGDDDIDNLLTDGENDFTIIVQVERQ